jgi:hypothetical protein
MSPLYLFCSLSFFSFSGVMVNVNFWFFILVLPSFIKGIIG